MAKLKVFHVNSNVRVPNPKLSVTEITRTQSVPLPVKSSPQIIIINRQWAKNCIYFKNTFAIWLSSMKEVHYSFGQKNPSLWLSVASSSMDVCGTAFRARSACVWLNCNFYKFLRTWNGISQATSGAHGSPTSQIRIQSSRALLSIPLPSYLTISHRIY